MFSLFARALAYQNLTPLERSILRFLESAVLGALVAGLQAALPLLTDSSLADPGTIPWASVLHTFLAALLVSLGLGVRKFLAAQADPPIPPSGAAVPSVAAGPTAAVASAGPAADPVPASVPDGVL